MECDGCHRERSPLFLIEGLALCWKCRENHKKKKGEKQHHQRLGTDPMNEPVLDKTVSDLNRY